MKGQMLSAVARNASKYLNDCSELYGTIPESEKDRDDSDIIYDAQGIYLVEHVSHSSGVLPLKYPETVAIVNQTFCFQNLLWRQSWMGTEVQKMWYHF